ncbi:MAG: DNA primase [Clostridiales bacterium]|jgi:DNA primase|nr:DNA primase [Clostridiales bacterium]
MGLNENIIDEIKSRCNIIDVVGRFVVLKKAGMNYKGLCPFHNEKTPSFVVSEDKQIFTCFGCGASGDVIEFYQRYHNMDFRSAIEALAAECGVEISSIKYHSEEKKSELYEINREAAAFFYRGLRQKENMGYNYLKNRGIDDLTLKRFGIGYADGEWQSLYDYFKNKGTDIDLLLSSGLISKSNGRYYDRFRNRVIFPIINTRKKVIGFGGRAIDEGMPKYLNSPESIVFQKKNSLYGLNLTRQDINREDCAILVEGYMDVISLYQHGVRNVVATLGTALTENQAVMLKRYTKNIILAYDNDEAGQIAALRGMDILYSVGCNVKVLQMERGKDPDDFIKEKGKDEFLKVIDKAMPFIDYKLHLLQSKLDLNTTEGALSYLKDAAKILKPLSPVEADLYIKKIAGSTKISEGAIRLEVYGNNQDYNTQKMTRTMKKDKNSNVGPSLLEKNLIKLMLEKNIYIPKLEPYVEKVLSPTYYHIYEILFSLYKEDDEIDIRKVKDSLDDKENVILKDIMDNIKITDEHEKVFEDCIEHIYKIVRKKREDEIIKLLSILDDDNDANYITELTNELIDIQRKNRGET